VAPQELLNRWIMPLERRVDFLTLHNGKKIEIPFEQLVVFSTNLNEKDLVDEAFLRRMGYRARIDPPSAAAYEQIFRRAASDRGIILDQASLSHVLDKYVVEGRLMKSCEPRDLLNRVTDVCMFEERTLQLTPELIDIAWKNYFGAAHGFDGGYSDVATEAKSAAV